MTATSATASSLPPVRTSTHVPLSLMTSISEETIALWLKLGALEKLEQAVLDGYGDQLCSKTSRIPQVNKFLKQVPLFQSKIRDIHQAVSQGRVRDVQHLIDRKKLAFCRDHNGASPLHKAVIFGHQDVIEYLVRRYGGAIHIRDHQGRTALHYAAFLPDRGEIYQYLLASGADERAMDVYGRQPSYYLDGQNEATIRQLREGTTLNGIRKIKPRYYGQVQPFSNSNSSSSSPGPVISKSQIRALIAEGSLEALEDLVLQGQGDRLLGETSPVPKIQSFLNIVPMYMERIYDVHRAVMRDQLEHVVFLLENRRLAMARDQLGATPLHKAVWFGHYKIAHYISHQFPETLNAIDLEGCTVLHYAAVLKDNKNMYGILIEAGANKAIFDNKGKTSDYYAQYPEHLNLDDVIKRCHKVNANYLANTANRIKGKSPVRQTPPPSNGNSSSPRSEENNGSSKESGQSNDSGNENELFSMLHKDNFSKRLDMSSANIRRWVNAKDMEKLEKAIMEGYGEKVVRAGEAQDKEDEDKLTDKITEMVERINAIHTAVSSDDLSELQNYLEEKYFALAKDHMGMTPLHRAVLLRRTNIVKFLAEKFPETINAKNKNGRTALHYAAATSRKDGQNLYKMLLQAGADPKVRDNHGRTPDYYKTHLMTMPNKGMMKTRPAGGRHSETLNRYSKQGVMERMTTAMQRGDVDLLHDLVLEGHGRHLLGKTSWNDDVKSFLKDLPSYLNTIQSFHEAVKEGDLVKVKKLLSSNDKLMRARDENSASPIHIAATSGKQEMMQYFVDNYPSVLNSKDSLGRTPLHIAGLKGTHEIFMMLKDAGVDTKHLDQKGKTADFYLENFKPDDSQTVMTNGCSDVSANSSSESLTSNLNRRENRSKLLRRNNRRGINVTKRDKVLRNKIPEEINENSENILSTVALRTKRKSEAKIIADENDGVEVETTKGEEENNAENAEVNGDIAAEADVEGNTDENDSEEKSDDSPDDPADSEENHVKTDDETAPEENEGDEGEDKGNDEDNLPADTENDDTNEIAVDDNEANEPDENEEEKDNEEENKDNENEDDAKTDEIEESKDEAEEAENEEAVADPTNEDEVNEVEEDAPEPPEAEGEENSNEDAPKDDEEENDATENQEEAGITVAEVGSGQAGSTDDVEISCEPTIEENNEENNQNENNAEEEESGEAKGDDAIENNDDENGEKGDEEEPEREVEAADDAVEGENEAGAADNEKENEDGTEESVEKEDTEEEKADEDKEEETVDEPKEEENDEKTEEAEGEENEEAKVEENGKEDQEKEIEENDEEKPEETNDNEKTEDDQETEEKTEEDKETEEKTDDDKIEEQTVEGEKPVNEEEKPGDNEEDNEEGKGDIEGTENNEQSTEATNAEEAVLEPETDSKPEDSEEAGTNNEEVNEAEGENVGDTAPENGEEQMDENKVEENNETDPEKNDDETKENAPANEQSHQSKDHLDELIEHWIREGDLLRLEHVVLAGQGDRLIERTSDDKQVQDFLDLVPIYMAKIRAVHESVAKGQLREVRSVLTRKRFALSRDHVGASPLHLAVLHGHTDVSTYIISHFPETMDGPDNEGRTPLHYATALQDTGTLYRLLKSAGADENIEDKAGYSPKYYLNHPGKLTLAQLLEPYSTTE